MVVAPRRCIGAVGRLPRMGSGDKLNVAGPAALPAPHRHDEGRVGRRLAILSGRTHEIPPSQFAGMVKYVMTVGQVAEVYGVPIAEIARVLREG